MAYGNLAHNFRFDADQEVKAESNREVTEAEFDRELSDLATLTATESGRRAIEDSNLTEVSAMKYKLITAVALAVAAAGCDLLLPTNDSMAAAPPTAGVAAGDFQPPLTEDGWLDLPALLVASDGSRSLGNHRARFNASRDRGSKIVFFDPFAGENDSADVYW